MAQAVDGIFAIAGAFCERRQGNGFAARKLLVTLNTDWSLDETSLTATATAEVEEPAQDDVHVSPEEMEDSQDE